LAKHRVAAQGKAHQSKVHKFKRPSLAEHRRAEPTKAQFKDVHAAPHRPAWQRPAELGKAKFNERKSMSPTPKKNQKTAALRVRLGKQQMAELNRLAKKQGRSRSDFVRTLLEKALAALCLALVFLMASCADGAGNAPTVPDAGPVAPKQGQDAQALQAPDRGPAIALPDALAVEPDVLPPDAYAAPVPPDAHLLAAPADAQPAGTPDAGTFPACDIRTIPRKCVAFSGPPPCVWLDSLVACRTIEMNCGNGVVCSISRIVVSNCDLCRLLVGP
jgi:hypothetical protein